jgi:hypothetical protein
MGGGGGNFMLLCIVPLTGTAGGLAGAVVNLGITGDPPVTRVFPWGGLSGDPVMRVGVFPCCKTRLVPGLCKTRSGLGGICGMVRVVDIPGLVVIYFFIGGVVGIFCIVGLCVNPKDVFLAFLGVLGSSSSSASATAAQDAGTL